MTTDDPRATYRPMYGDTPGDSRTRMAARLRGRREERQ